MIVQCICWYDNKRSSKTYSCQLNSQQSKHTKVTNIYICSQLSQQPVRTVLISYFFSRFVQFCFFLFFVYIYGILSTDSIYFSIYSICYTLICIKAKWREKKYFNWNSFAGETWLCARTKQRAEHSFPGWASVFETVAKVKCTLFASFECALKLCETKNNKQTKHTVVIAVVMTIVKPTLHTYTLYIRNEAEGLHADCRERQTNKFSICYK